MMRSITTPAATSLQPVFPAIEEALQQIPGFAQASQQVANAIHSAVLDSDGARDIVDLLHGSRLGHPVHPAIVHLPIGAWVFSALFDGLALATRSRQSAQTADTLLALGTLAALPVALSGAADFSAADDTALPEIALHALLNDAAIGLYLLSLGARRSGHRARGTLFSSIGLACVVASASIGGDLVYRKRVGVNHSALAPGLDGWTHVLGASELPEGKPHRVAVNGVGVLLYRDADAIHAIGADCMHAGAPLEEGRVSGHCLECPWHQSVFDLRDGSVVHGPATQPQPRYLARQREGRIELRRLGATTDAEPETRPAELGQEQERELGGLGI
jgi:nitrite reductase/ring-hydroxylating ferredoxin subunit/uncharacterized membrane protein